MPSSRFAKISDVFVGTALVADAGFTCLAEGQVVVVERSDEGAKFVRCREGTHMLDGQSDGAHYVGLTLSNGGCDGN